MTEAEFFAALEATPRTWFTCMRVGIRSGCECPITQVARMRGFICDGAADYEDAAIELGLESRFADAVVAAADKLTGYDPDLRARLERACGIPPTWTERT